MLFKVFVSVLTFSDSESLNLMMRLKKPRKILSHKMTKNKKYRNFKKFEYSIQFLWNRRSYEGFLRIHLVKLKL
jgi:hypothetical protein